MKNKIKNPDKLMTYQEWKEIRKKEIKEEITETLICVSAGLVMVGMIAWWVVFGY